MSQLSGYLGFFFALEKSPKVGSQSSKWSKGGPTSGNPTGFMLGIMVSSYARFQLNGPILLRESRVTMAIIRNIPIRQHPSFMKYTRKGYPASKKNQNGIPTLIGTQKLLEALKIL